MTPPEVSVDELLAQRGWVRALARTLVRDDAAADDVEQSVWLAALRRPPRAGGSLRAWFASVVRSRARDRARIESRRAERETAAARPEATASAADVAATTEVHRGLAAALLTLDEPYRSAVILRYFEDLPPREIGARTGVPTETARTRVRRGVARLREQLDANHGGDRRAWTALVAPLGLRSTGDAAFGGGVIVATKKAAALAALVVATLAAGAAWWLATERDAPRHADVSDATAAAPHGGRSRSPRADRARAADHPPPGVAPAAATAPNDRPVFLVVDAVTGEALAGASVWVVCADGSTRTAVALGDGGGLALEPSLVGRLATLWAAAPAHARRRLTDVTLDAAPRTLALDPAVAPRIEFVTETGRALGREELRLRFGGSIPSSALALVADDVFRGGDVARTLPLLFGPADAWRAAVSLADDGASMRLADGAASGRWRLFVERPGAAAWISAPFEAGADAVIAVPMPEVMATRRVRFVADDTGAPVADARIVAWHELGRETPALRGAELRADGQGCVTLPYEPPETRGDGVRPRWQLDAPGRAAMIDAWREIDRAAAADPVETAVPRSATVEGEAYLPSGLPAAGLRVVTADTGFAWGATVGADGRFRIEGAPARDGSVHLILYAGSSMSQSRAQVGDDGVAHAVIGAKSEPVRARIEGRVTIGGAPLAGALICDQPVDRKGSFVRTDRDGRFALDGLDVAVEHDLVVYLGDPQAGDSRHRIRTRAPLRLEAARPVDVAFDLPSGTIRATVLDADTGAPVPGARVSARPAAPSPPGGRLPGFDHGAGWADFSGADGVVLLAALEPGAAHVVRAEADGYEPAERNDVVPGSAEHPAPLALRLSKLR